MAKPLSYDLRLEIIKSHKRGVGIRQIATSYNTSPQVVSDLVNQYQLTGDVWPRDGTRGANDNKLSQFHGWLQQEVSREPETSFAQLANQLFEQFGVSVNRVSVWRYMQKTGIIERKSS